MKTIDFLNKLENSDYENCGITASLTKEYDEKYIEIKSNNFYALIHLTSVDYRIRMHNGLPPKSLLELIFEYVETPLEEREEDNKYKLRLKGIRDEENYLNYSESECNFLISSETDSVFFKTIFTQSEIDNLPDEIKKHNLEYIEVEL